MESVELRCPVERQRMFGKLMLSGKFAITDSNLMEFACDRCKKRKGCVLVLHRFNIAGELVETEDVF